MKESAAWVRYLRFAQKMGGSPEISGDRGVRGSRSQAIEGVRRLRGQAGRIMAANDVRPNYLTAIMLRLIGTPKSRSSLLS